MKTLLKVVVVAIALTPMTPALGANSANPPGPPWFQQFVDDVRVTIDSIKAKIAELDALITENAANAARNADEITGIKEGLGRSLVTFDYRDYNGNNDSTKVFASTGGIVCGTTEIHIVRRAPQADGTVQVTETRDRRLANNIPCQLLVSDLLATDAGFFLVRDVFRNPTDPATVLTTNVLDDPLLLRTSTMRVGSSWGSASRSTLTIAAIGVEEMRFATQFGTLLAVEAVTVPAGTFSDCLKLSEPRNSAHFGNFTQVSWYCRDFGLVKRFRQNTTNENGFLIELQSFTQD